MYPSYPWATKLILRGIEAENNYDFRFSTHFHMSLSRLLTQQWSRFSFPELPRQHRYEKAQLYIRFFRRPNVPVVAKRERDMKVKMSLNHMLFVRRLKVRRLPTRSARSPASTDDRWTCSWSKATFKGRMRPSPSAFCWLIEPYQVSIPYLLPYLGDPYAESGQTLQSSFSAVSKPNFASKY